MRFYTLNCKHRQSASLKVANPDPIIVFAKYQTIFKPFSHIALYISVDYPTYCQFISRIESTASACKLNDAETVTYAILGLDYTEKEL